MTNIEALAFLSDAVTKAKEHLSNTEIGLHLEQAYQELETRLNGVDEQPDDAKLSAHQRNMLDRIHWLVKLIRGDKLQTLGLCGTNYESETFKLFIVPENPGMFVFSIVNLWWAVMLELYTGPEIVRAMGGHGHESVH